MSQTLTMLINLFAYSDASQTNNPKLRDFDYARQISDISTSKTRSQQHIVSVAETETVLSLQRSLTPGASWTVSNPGGMTARYTWSGTNPVLRAERTGSALTIASTVDVVRLGANSKVFRLTFSDSPGTGILPGDEIFIGEDSGVNELNTGIFTVVAASGNTVDVLSENMVNETGVTIADPTQIYAYNSGPVRVGDFLKVSSTAFSFGNRGEYQITKVTSRFVEVQNSEVSPEGPVTADIVVYDQLYKLTYIETDQKINIYLNGGSEAIQVEPIQDGEPALVGIYLARGPVFSVIIENVGLSPAKCTTFFAT